MYLPFNFYDFTLVLTNTNYLHSQDFVFNHDGYNPYSNDLDILKQLLENNEYQKVIDYNTINTVLSTDAFILKFYAYQALEEHEQAKVMFGYAKKIIEAILKTGDGSLEAPYVVLRISDIYDVLSFLSEKVIKQKSMKQLHKQIDLIECASGKVFYFDVSKPISKIKE